MSVNSALTAIGNTIRSLLGTSKGYKLDQMPAAISDIYDAGKQSMIDESKIIEKSVSGRVVSVDDVSEVPHDVKITLTCDTPIQDYSSFELALEGDNLHILTATSKTQSGVTFTVDADGFIAANGKSTGTIYLHCGAMAVESGKSYYCSGCPTGGASGVYSIAFQKQLDGANKGAISDYGNGAEIVVDDTFNGINVVVVIGSGQTLNNMIFRPRIQHSDSRDESIWSNVDGVFTIPSKSPNMTIRPKDSSLTVWMDYHKSYGMQTEYDRFWDAYQAYGTKTAYGYMFAGYGWTDSRLKPKYPLRATETSSMNYGYMFYYNKQITKTPVVYFGNTTAASHLNGTFTQCTNLKEINFEGEIKFSLDIRHSPLTKDCMIRIVNTLSGDVSGQTLTFNKAAKESNFTDDEWATLIKDITNWSFSLL